MTIVCIRTHSDTRALLGTDPGAMSCKTIIDLSTGDAGEATALRDWIKANGADCLIGMISTFPKGIGKADSAIVAVGDAHAWEACEPIIKALAGKSTYVGEDPRALAAIFASLFLPRQGFMFGMIYGALICEKAGVSMDDYVELLPLTIKVVGDYYDLFANTVPRDDFSDPPASIGTYAAAFQDTLATRQDLGLPRCCSASNRLMSAERRQRLRCGRRRAAEYRPAPLLRLSGEADDLAPYERRFGHQ